jgi:hypothetical protein
MNRSELTRSALSILLVATLLLSAIAGSAGVAAADNQAVDYEQMEGPRIDVPTVTVAEHNLSEHASAIHVDDDNGDPMMLPAWINDTTSHSGPAETVGVRYDKIDDEDLREFPRKDDEGSGVGASAVLDTADWSTDASGSGGSISVSSASPHNVDQVVISTSSQGSNDHAVATYSNFSISSDPTKRVASTIFNVTTINSDAQVNVSYVDGDGDAVNTTIDPDGSASAAEVMATGTLDGGLHQERLSNLTGSSNLDGIEKIEVHVTDGDATVAFTHLDVGRKSTLDFGETVHDEDGDGTAEETKLIEDDSDGGVNQLTGVDTLPSMLDDGSIYDLEVNDVEFRCQDQDAEDVDATFSEAPNYNWDRKLDYKCRLTLPALIDVSYSSPELEERQALVDDRYVTYEYKESAGSTDLENVSSWTDLIDKLGSEDNVQSLDSSITVGDNYVTHSVVTLTAEQADEWASTGGGGGGGFWGGSGPIGGFLNMILAGLAGVAGLFGLKGAARRIGG